MSSREEKEKESVKKLLKFIVTATSAYLAFLQIAVLVHHYSIKEKIVSHGVSQEDAPIPSITLCGETHKLIKQDVLAKYGVTSLLLEQDPDKPVNYATSQYVRLNWRRFDWSSISLKQLYNEAVIYPHYLLASCQIGDNYNCTESEDIYHRWEHVLKRSYTCSTLRITKKLTYGERTKVDVQLKWPLPSIIQFQLYDALKSSPRYVNKFAYNEYRSDDLEEIEDIGVQQPSASYNVEKADQLSEGGEGSCSKDPTTDFVKCQEDCFEKTLLQDNSSCVLPWMMSDKRQCSNIDEALVMVKKEKELQNIQCDCQDYCTKFNFIPYNRHHKYKETMGIDVIIDNSHGINTLHESYMYSFIDFISNCGGSLGIFFSVSLLWLIEEVIKALCSFERFSKYLSHRFGEPLVKCFLKISLLACFSLFFYESYLLISKYVENAKTLTVDRLHPMESPHPQVKICNSEMNDRFYTTAVKGNGDLINNYKQILYESPLHHMIECHVDNEICMADGRLFSWDTFYGDASTCSILNFNSTQYSSLEIIFDDAFVRFTVSLSSFTAFPKYELDAQGSHAYLLSNYYVSLGYNSDQKYHLPPCSDNYIQCRERCWEQQFLKEDLCTPTEMPSEVKYQPCITVDDVIALWTHYATNKNFLHLCKCDRQCSDLVYTFKGSQNVYDTKKSQLRVSLVPLQFTRTSEEWAYPFNSLIAGIGGTLGVITGMSFLSVLLQGFSKIEALVNQDSAKNVLTKNVVSFIIYLTIWGFASQQIYTSFAHYIEGHVQLNEEIDKESVTILPHITFCYYTDMFYLLSGRVNVYSPYQGSGVPYSIKKDINWNLSTLHIDEFLIDCTVFGLPCKHRKGEIHEWHNVRNVNRICSRLEIKPIKLRDYRSNRLTLKVNEDSRIYLSNPGENRLFHLPAALDDFSDLLLPYKAKYFLYQSQYKLLPEIPNNCINRLGYSRRNCLDECVSDHIQETLRCRFPWMKVEPSLPVCLHISEFRYLESINASLLIGCQCLLPCQYTDSYLKHRDTFPTLLNNEAITEITVLESKKVYKESWSYTASRFLADLGGLMSLFTGFTVYHCLLRSASYFMSFWKLFWRIFLE